MTQEEIEQGIEKIKARMDFPNFSCPEGWFPLIVQLDRDLAKIDPDYTIAQIKEKFAGLRYYAYPSDGTDNEFFYSTIHIAENASFSMCEISGGPGVRMKKIGGAWHRTLDPELPGILEQWEILDEAWLKNKGLL